MKNLSYSEALENQTLEFEKGPPNSWSDVYIKNEWGSPITKVEFLHRYESDRYDTKSFELIDSDQRVFAIEAGYWTGIGRVGKDYWWIKFKDDQKTWTCKANFFCYLTAKDAKSDRPVEIVIKRNKMEVSPPVSGSDYVTLYPEA